MDVTVLYFASVREALGLARESWSTQARDVAGLRAELIARGAPWAEALEASRALRCAVNQVMREDTAVLAAGDEVAFFPPVTGG